MKGGAVITPTTGMIDQRKSWYGDNTDQRKGGAVKTPTTGKNIHAIST